MLLVIKAVLSLMIGLIFSLILALLIIPYLKKVKAKQYLSIYLRETHKKKQGTPTMGGIIFILPPLFMMLIFYLWNKIIISYNLLIVLIVFSIYALIGFLDDFLIIKRGNNKGLTEGQKFMMQLVAAILFFLFFMLAGNEPLLWIHFLNLRIDIGWFYGLFILFVLVASSNAVNLTDGLDGLAGGLSFIAILTFGIITMNTGWLEGFQEISIFLFALAGSIFGFLLFNTNPAKIFMGDTGSLALGAVLGTVAILTRHELLLIIVGIVFVIETITCILQIFYFKLTRKRLFLMTPIHHSFEKKGWREQDIVKLFWLIGLFGSLIGLIYGVWL